MPGQTVGPSDASAAARFAPVRLVLDRAIADRAFPGAAWGVLHRGRVATREAAGRFTYEANAPLVTPDTVFDIASVSKVVATTAAAMLLVYRGQLDLETRVGDLLPGFVIGMEPGSGKQNVTVRMLLAHTSGLTAYAPLLSGAHDAERAAAGDSAAAARSETRCTHGVFRLWVHPGGKDHRASQR